MPKRLPQVNETKEIELHPKQFEAFDFKTQFCAAIAGVRGGKTYVGSAWAGNKIEKSSGNGLITAPDYKTLNDATLNTFFSLFPQYRRFYKQQRGVIELPGKTIFLRSLDDPLSAEGITVDWFWGDEAGKYKLLAWHSLRSRVSLTKGQGLLTTTPYNMGWLYQEFYLPWERKEDSGYTVINWRSLDNPYFPRDVYEDEKRRLPDSEFKRRYEGLFTRMSGLVYNLQPYHLIEEPPVRSDITLGGIDWGWSNPAAISIVKIFNGAYYVVDEWYATEHTTGQIIEQAIAMQNKWGVNRWYADSASPEKIAEANANTGLYVLPYKKGPGSINARVGFVQNCLLENRLYVVRGLKDHLAEFETYQYPEKNDNGQVVKDEPMPFNNHLMDAMSYAIHGYQPARRVRAPVPEGGHTSEALRRLLGNKAGGTADAIEVDI